MLISVDPGKKLCGVAVWNQEEKTLTKAFLVKLSCDLWTCMAADVLLEVYDALEEQADDPWDLVIELPQVYKHSPGDPNDLIDLACVAGGIVLACAGKVTMVKPHAWKGNVPKKTMNSRIVSQLSPSEVKKVTLPKQLTLQHNVWDAVGVGLHFLRRL